MTSVIRSLSVGAVLCCAAIGVAAQASADPAAGDYTGTIIDGGGGFNNGDTAPFTLNPCGPDCIHLVQLGDGWELHRQGTTWIETDPDGTTTRDEGTLVLRLDSARGNHVVIGLTKNA